MSHLSQRRRRRARVSIVKSIARGTAIAVGLAMVLVTGVLIWALGVASSDPSLSDARVRPAWTTEVLAADGSRLGYIASDTVRQPVPGHDLPRRLKEATVAIEDRDFWDHGALDYEAIARAALHDLEAGRVEEGGSTITQQLVKNLYIQSPADTLSRKIQEAKLAIELADSHSKTWILNRYLNSVPYGTEGGRTAIGAQAAAQIFFGRPASALNLRQAALLAGLPQAPTEYDPLIHPKRALERRNVVLEEMHSLGYISDAELEHATAGGLGLHPSHRYENVQYPYFFDYVQQRLLDRYGVDTVREGGLEVHTTIDPHLQALAQAAVDDGAAVLGGPSAALVSIDPSDGHILAMAASTDYSVDKFNLAAQAHRQPGSAFKPFVLATAMRQGVDPDTTYYDGTSPVTLHPTEFTTWTVNNAEPGGGTMSVTNATTDSVNAVFAQLDLDVGPTNVAETAHSMGISSPLDGYPAEGIGGLRVGVSPLEMSDAYATLADGGMHHRPAAIERVVFPSLDGGPRRSVTLGDDPGSKALSPAIAAKETEILKTVIESGTGTSANIGCPAAGKTGTTDDYTDAWFVGFTPRLSTAVWTGYPDARTSMGSEAFGGTYAAPIWAQFMSDARGDFCGDFPQAPSPYGLQPLSGGHSLDSSSGYSSSGSYGGY